MANLNAINKKSGELTIDPGASGDSYVQFDINTTGEFRIGVDDDDGDSFKISQGSSLGTNDTVTITAAGEIRKPLTPAFLAIITSPIANVTGDGTTYTVVYDTEIFDQNSDFDGTSTFTAPITGRYYFIFCASMDDLAAGNTNGFTNILTSNRSYLQGSCEWGPIRNSTDETSITFAAFADMDAADTAITRVQVTSGTKIVDVNSISAADPRTWFGGYLVC